MTTATPTKPQPVERPSDDFTLVVDGETYHPHAGESVTLFPGLAVGDFKLLNRFSSMGARLSAVEGDADEFAQAVAIADEAFDDALTMLADRLVSWTWTDNRGRPMPPLDGTTGPLQSLRVEEVRYLLSAVQGETASQRKKGSKR